MTKQWMGAIAMCVFSQSVTAGACFSALPEVRSENTPPFGWIYWSPLQPVDMLRSWLLASDFQAIPVKGPEAGEFWVKGECLAQVTVLDGTDQAWLVGSEFGDIWSEVLEVNDAHP